MRILAMDTSLAACSAAVWRDGAVISREFAPMQRGQAEALLPMLERVRLAAGLDYAQFDRLAVSVGPGSFAGIRIGLAAARGLALALGLPLAGIGTLEVLAAASPGNGPVAAVLDARNNQLYLQLFTRALQPLGAAALLGLDDALGICRAHNASGELRLVGSGAPQLAPGLQTGPRYIDALALPDAGIVAARAALCRALPGNQVAPLYLRPPDAKLPPPSA